MPLLYNSPVLWNTSLYSYNGIALIVGETRSALTGTIRDLSILTTNVTDRTPLTGTVSDLTSSTASFDDWSAASGTVSDLKPIAGTVSDFSAIIWAL